jgi:hypothetical protein
MANLELQILGDSDSYLVKSMLFLVLVAFNEFAHKQVYQLVKPHGPAPPLKGAFTFIKKALIGCQVIHQEPAAYQQHFAIHFEPVRNNFAHGDWRELQETLAAVDLAQSFEAVREYFCTIRDALVSQGFNV